MKLQNPRKIIHQGAEAIIIQKENNIIKKRIEKKYRIKKIDEKLRKLRTRSEGKLLTRASKVISVPKIIKIDEKEKEIILEFIQGQKLSECLNDFSLKKQKQISKEIGKNIAKLHKEDIIHGDLTTANMILSKNKIYFFDFGLGYISKKIEDRAVDLHLLKEIFNAGHFKHFQELFQEILKGYKEENKEESEKVIQRLEKVAKRGRYKMNK